MQVLCWPAGNIKRTATTDALNRSDLAIFPLLFLGANYAYVRALALASPAIVQCVLGAAPAVVCVLSRLWLREPFTRRRGLAVGAALCGVALVAAPSGSGSHHLTIGAVIALCGGVHARFAADLAAAPALKPARDAKRGFGAVAREPVVWGVAAEYASMYFVRMAVEGWVGTRRLDGFASAFSPKKHR